MQAFKIRLLAAAAIAATVLTPIAAQAAVNWVLPSTTTVAGDRSWVTVDAATSDQAFSPNLRALPLDTIQIFDAEGQAVTPQTASQGRLRSSFDIQIAKPGTYKIASVSTAIIASWTENGEVKRFRGTGADFAKQVPAGAADLKTVRTLSRYETFVTRDNPTTEVFKTTGEGLEMVPVTHPADIVAGEAASFRFLLDGKPAAGLEVVLKRGGDFWEAKPPELTLKTGADGGLKVTLPKSGVWLISASYRTGDTGRPAPGGPPPAGGPGGPPGPGGPGAPPRPAQPLAGDGYGANYSATIEAQIP